MNGIQLNGNRGCNYEKPIPGCLGRMVNLFDLTPSGARNRLLTDKPHRDGLPLARSRSDVSRMSSPIHEEIEDKMTVCEVRRLSSNKKPEGTPVKLLIAQEMSKDLELKQSSPNVVAKLMGLDALPQQDLSNVSHGRSHSKGHPRHSYSEIPAGYWQQEGCCMGEDISCDVHQCPEQCKFKDIYEIWEPTQGTNTPRDVSPNKVRHIRDNSSERKMALIRQKFMEAKRLSTDEKLRQTKEFQDALEVLSSNQDLFLRVLQEPNSMISHHLYGGQPVPPPSETKRITVLKPSNMMFNDKFPASLNKSGNNARQYPQGDHVNGWNEDSACFPAIPAWKIDDSTPTQPTRIVVLKPSAGKIQDVKAVVSSTPSSPRNLERQSFFEVPAEEDEQAREARQVAKEITQQMRENLAGHRRDETLLSSVFSNGYTGDESSFNKSEAAEFVTENLSDLEVMSPPSRHSWDYVNRFGSPFSCSSLSRASMSPESSVCREAKKRLSERWAMMASNGGSSGEPKHIRRSSSTLGEMLALSDLRKAERDEITEDCHNGQDARASTSCLASNTGDAEIESPRSLLRSKSLPVSANAFSERSYVEGSDKVVGKTTSFKDSSKSTTAKSTFRGKVTSLFFSRSKKSSKEKLNNPQKDTEISPSAEPLGRSCGNTSSNYGSEDILPHLPSTSRTFSPESDLCESSLLKKSALVGNSVQNQDHPSPISVLEPLSEEDAIAIAALGCSRMSYPDQPGKQMSFCLGKSNLIDKSPPIGSIARTLSWDEPCSEIAATSNPLKSTFSSPGVRPDEDEGEWLSLVQSLLSLAGIEDESQLISNPSLLHSPSRPLNPLLREKYINLDTKGPLLDGNCWRRQASVRKLVFDCVDAVFADRLSRRCVGQKTQSGSALVDRIWAQMKEWVVWSGEETDGGLYYGEEDSNSLVVERAVRKELVGRGWDDQIRMEIDDVGTEIEKKLLEQLVEESVCEAIVL